jgi:hypothetical protein
MSGRRDYYRDPSAPKANSLKPGGSALVVDEQGRILMQRRSDSGNWALRLQHHAERREQPYLG